MNFSIQREDLLKPLQLACGVVERRQTLPILSHVLLTVDEDRLALTATDLEVEMVVGATVSRGESGEITVPGRKFMDICRALPEGAQVELAVEGERAVIRAGKSRFTLSTLPANDFPSVEAVQEATRFSVAQQDLKFLLDHTHFAMAQQDVRYYLNGLLLEVGDNTVRTVATDGHRLSLCAMEKSLEGIETQQVILPRKAVLELMRLLEESDSPAAVEIGSNHIKLGMQQLSFTSKLIDGRFPDYQRVLPEGGDKRVMADRDSLKQALARVSILSNEKYRGVRLILDEGSMRILANNPEQEEAEEELEVQYSGEELEIGFNVTYLVDALSALESTQAELYFSDANSSCLIQPEGSSRCRYVVMPMRL